MSNIINVYVKPSSLEPGMNVGRDGKLSYVVLSEPAEQSDGSICVMVQYADGGRSQREWDSDDATVPLMMREAGA